MSKENKTRYALLGLLNHEDLTGYEIKKRIDNSLKLFWDAGFGQIYPTLKLLEKDGHLRSYSKKEDNESDKIYYSITETGKNELMDWLKRPVEKENVKYEILLKLFFGGAQSLENNINNIAEFKDRNEGTLELLQSFKSNLEQVLDGDNDHIYYYLTVLFGEKVYKAYLEWADEAILILKDKKNI